MLWCVCDQVVKAYMEAHTPSTALVPVIDGVVGFRLVHNFGAAWGSFSGMVIVLVIVSIVLCAIILAALAFFSWRMNEAYVNVMDACNRVNDLADTVQTSLDTLDQAQLDSMMQDLPEITAQLKKVDVDALNKVLTELPALMDTVNSLQTQVQNISNWFSSLGSVFGR